MRPATTYRAFLVRMWGHGRDADRRFSVVDVESGEARLFVDADSLCAWIRSIEAPETSAVASAVSPQAPVDSA